MRRSLRLLLPAAGVAVLVVAAAEAHISGPATPLTANTTQEITLGVGHGCGGADTVRAKVDIPAGVTSVRPLHGDLGKAAVEIVDGGVASITWEKPGADALLADTHYYKLTFRARLPNAPFTRVPFPVHQWCRAADGGVTAPVDWVAPPDTVVPDGGTAPEPAPVVVVMPARAPGWNKYTVPVDVPDVSVYLKDAAIVWKGSAAYSSNAQTLAQIKAEPGVTELKSLRAGDEILVRY